MLYSSIASVRGKGGEKSRGTTTTRERQPNNGLATLVALFVRTRLLCAVLLLVVAGIGAVSPIFIPRESAIGTALTLVSLCLSLALGLALFIGAVVARRWTSALVHVLDDLSQGRYSPRNVPGTEAGEIGSLSRAVDTAASQIQGRLGRLEQTEAQFRSLLSCLPGVPYIYNACQDGEIEVLYVSPKIQELLGFTQTEWLNDPTLWSQQLHNDDRARVLAQYTSACERGETFACEYRILTKDGRTVWLRDEARITQSNEGSAGSDGTGQFMLGMLMDAGILTKATLPYALVGITVWKLGMGYVLYDLQQRGFALHEYYGGVVRNGALVLVASIFLGSRVIQALAGGNTLLLVLFG